MTRSPGGLYDRQVATPVASWRAYARHPRCAIRAHESEAEAVSGLEGRGLRFDSSTRAMAMSLHAPRYVDHFEGMPNLLRGTSAAEFHLRVARLDGREVGAAIAYDHDGDCGIFNLGTPRRKTSRSAFEVSSAARWGMIGWSWMTSARR